MKTLEPYSNAQAWKIVYEHEKQQGTRAVEEFDEDDMNLTSCRFRTTCGCRCYIGALIPDDDYQPSMEGKGPDSLRRLYPQLGRLWKNLDVLFLSKMLQIHDNSRDSSGAASTTEIRQAELLALFERFKNEEKL